jgi:excinuclease ABC subunit A
VILFGTGEEITFTYDDGLRTYKTTKPFEGVIGNIERRWRETDSAWVREELSRFQSEPPLPGVRRLPPAPEALAVKINGRHISARSGEDVDPRGQ